MAKPMLVTRMQRRSQRLGQSQRVFNMVGKIFTGVIFAVTLTLIGLFFVNALLFFKYSF
jgi:hypothetical protein